MFVTVAGSVTSQETLEPLATMMIVSPLATAPTARASVSHGAPEDPVPVESLPALDT
jgi:hypothetical protein